jgi:glycosyltransferase involved in cell wall biosynthesis
VPFVTVAVPFFNAERTLVNCIRSVFAQSFTDWELLLIDDGSSDASLRIARSVQDYRVRVVSDGTNRGLVARLNQTPSLAKGALLARMDADDLMHPERLSRQVRFFLEHPSIDVVTTGCCSISEDLVVHGVRDLGPLRMTPWHVLIRGEIFHASIMARRQWFMDHPYDPFYIRAEDRELWLRTLTTSHFARIREPLYFCTEVNQVRVGPYLLSYKSERRAIARHGPRLIGWPLTAALIARSHAKSVALRILASIKHEQRISRSRYMHSPLIADLQNTIGRIIETPVPGLNASAW